MAMPAPDTDAPGPNRATPYGWLVFALIVLLLLSDYMSRQVLGAVTPLLKAEWHLSDEQLGRLGSVIPLMVGLLTFPLSLAADRFGRVRAIVAMALVWSVATLSCGLASTFGELLAARAVIGFGEAAYGSAGLAVVLGAFPVRMRAMLTAGFMAGGPLGSVVGVALGGSIAADHGWRWAFAAMGIGGCIIALAFAAIAREARLAPPQAKERAPIRSVIAGRALRWVYVGSGLQLFICGVITFWLPSYFGRVQGYGVAEAAQLAAVVLLAQAVGMVLCGMLSDRIAGTEHGERRFAIAAGVGLASAALLTSAFLLPPSPLQMALLLAGTFVAAGTTGPVGSLVAQLTPAALHGTAFAVVTLANNAFGLAPGPWLAGWLADRLPLDRALALCALVPLGAALAFILAARAYRASQPLGLGDGVARA
ncbi:MAG: MFS transporter [Novosphingobium sp.]